MSETMMTIYPDSYTTSTVTGNAVFSNIPNIVDGDRDTYGSVGAKITITSTTQTKSRGDVYLNFDLSQIPTGATVSRVDVVVRANRTIPASVTGYTFTEKEALIVVLDDTSTIKSDNIDTSTTYSFTISLSALESTTFINSTNPRIRIRASLFGKKTSSKYENRQFTLTANVYNVELNIYYTPPASSKIKVNEAWVDAETKIKVNGAWIEPDSIFVKTNGSWEEI